MAFNIDKDILELEVDCFTCKEQASEVLYVLNILHRKTWCRHINVFSRVQTFPNGC